MVGLSVCVPRGLSRLGDNVASQGGASTGCPDGAGAPRCLQGENTLGNVTVGVGVVSLVIALVLVSLVIALVLVSWWVSV